MHAQLLVTRASGLLLLYVLACPQLALATSNTFERSAQPGETSYGHDRALLQAASSSSANANISSAAVAPISNPTILQTADATFRLAGSDTLSFNNATATAFQQALQEAFSNYSYASFQYQSFMVLSQHFCIT